MENFMTLAIIFIKLKSNVNLVSVAGRLYSVNHVGLMAPPVR